jgi:hypothetical protein
MSNIKIKAQSLPQRCEVCHQSDCFDAIAGHCTRCQGMVLQSTLKKLAEIQEAVLIAEELAEAREKNLLSSIKNMPRGLKIIFAILILILSYSLLSYFLGKESAISTIRIVITTLFVLLIAYLLPHLGKGSKIS